MSAQPIEPTDPATPVPTAPQEPAAATPEAPRSDPAPAPNAWENPETAKAEIERLRRENAKDRTSAKQSAADEARAALAQDIGKALGLVKDEPVDPATLIKQATADKADARQARVELAVYRNAGDLADPVKLLDSSSFLAKTANLDPSDTAAIQAAIQEAVTANPWLGATPSSRIPAPNPAQGASGSGAPTQEDAQYAAFFPTPS